MSLNSKLDHLTRSEAARRGWITRRANQALDKASTNR